MGETEWAAAAAPAPDLPPSHLAQIADALIDGRLVPFLGAGVNLVARPQGKRFNPEKPEFLPDGAELARYLIRRHEELDREYSDLIRVSQYVLACEGDGPLFTNVEQLVAKEAYAPTAVHTWLAAVWRRLAATGRTVRYPVIMTTNYDDMMERAFLAQQPQPQPFDVLRYAWGEHRQPLFMHTPWGSGERIPVIDPDAYTAISTEHRPVLVKLHGGIKGEPGPFVIAEDHYVQYLTAGGDMLRLIPSPIRQLLPRSHFLFLGYGLSDWNMRVMMHRVATERRFEFNSWAIQLATDPLDRAIWQKRRVSILTADLGAFVTAADLALQRRLDRPGADI
jgi:hypothetical protein